MNWLICLTLILIYRTGAETPPPSDAKNERKELKQLYNAHLHWYQEAVDNLIRVVVQNTESDLPEWYRPVVWACMRRAPDVRARATCASRAFDIRATFAMDRRYSNSIRGHHQPRLIRGTTMSPTIRHIINPLKSGHNNEGMARSRLDRFTEGTQNPIIRPVALTNTKQQSTTKRIGTRLIRAQRPLRFPSVRRRRRSVNHAFLVKSGYQQNHQTEQMSRTATENGGVQVIDLLVNLVRRFRGKPVVTGTVDTNETWQRTFDRFRSLIGLTNQLQSFGLQTQDNDKNRTVRRIGATSQQSGPKSKYSAGLEVLSPKFLALTPESKQNKLFSPNLLSLYDSNDALSLASMLGATNQWERDSWTRLIAEASGATDVVQRVLDWFDAPSNDQAQQYVKAQIRLAEVWQRYTHSLSHQQKADIDRIGYTFLESKQYDILFGPSGLANRSQLHFDPSIYANLSWDQQQLILEDGIRELAGERARSPLSKWNRRLRDAAVIDGAVGVDYFDTGLLSPAIFAVGVLEPSVLGHATLSPALFSPAILSPAVLNALTLSPGVGNPDILSPTVLTADTLSPSVLSPAILSPGVLGPAILSPSVLGHSILSPSVLSPSILSPSVLGGSVLSPAVLSPSVLSDGVEDVDVLSPSVLSRR